MEQSPQFPKFAAQLHAGRAPSFSTLADIIRVGLTYELTVSVLCLRQTDRRRWQRVADESPAHRERLAVHDLSRRTLDEWCAVLAASTDDLLILAGFHRALARGGIAPAYVTALIDAAERATVVLA